MHCVFARRGLFHESFNMYLLLKIQTIKLAHTLEIDCFLTGNNQLCFSSK